MPDFRFVGPLPEWLDPERIGWSFREAGVVFGTAVLGKHIQSLNVGRSINEPRIVYDPNFPAPSVDVTDQWWDKHDPHTPSLLSVLLLGRCRAFGDPVKTGTWPEWIQPRSWRDLKFIDSGQHTFQGGGAIYYNVRIVDMGEIRALAEVQLDDKQDEQPSPSKGGRTPSPRLYPFVYELLRLASHPDGLPDESSLSAHMRDWVATEFSDGQPAETTVRAWIRKMVYGKDR